MRALWCGALIVLSACGESHATDAGVDAGMRDAGHDAGPFDAGRDAGRDAGPFDAGPNGVCIPYVFDLMAPPDGGRGLGETIAAAVGQCVRAACVDCAIAGGYGEACNGGTLTTCVLACVESNDLGECPAAGCPMGQSCDTSVTPSVCRSEDVTTVTDAIAAGSVDLECTTCFVQIAQCIAQNACTVRCVDSSSCDCGLCMCNAGCLSSFSYCSGLPPFRDCAEIRATCGP
jgi:hypothetical protein